MRDRNLQLLRVLIREEITRVALEEGLWDDIKSAGSKVIGKLRGEPRGGVEQQPAPMRGEQSSAGALSAEASKLENVIGKLKKLSEFQDTVNSFYQNFSTLKDPHQAMSTVRARVMNQINLTKKVTADAFNAYVVQQGLKNKDDNLIKATTELIGPSGMHEARYADKPQLTAEEEKFIDTVRRIAGIVSSLKTHALFRRSDASEPYVRDVSNNLYNETKNFAKAYADIVRKIQKELIGPVDELISILRAPRAARKPRG
jgi:hypothetical protein